jgi:hypothetical protein
MPKAQRTAECGKQEARVRLAAELLRTAVPDGAKLSASFARLLDVKDEAHYGVIVVSPRKARDTVRWAGSLVARAADEVER